MAPPVHVERTHPKKDRCWVIHKRNAVGSEPNLSHQKSFH